jgi:hypothetical protein
MYKNKKIDGGLAISSKSSTSSRSSKINDISNISDIIHKPTKFMSTHKIDKFKKERSRSYNNNKSEIFLKPITINIANYDTYFIDKIDEISSNYNNTNNGVLLDSPTSEEPLINFINYTQGGASLFPIGNSARDQASNRDRYAQLRAYCSAIRDDNDDIDLFLTGSTPEIRLGAIIARHDYAILSSFISNNKNTKREDIIIPYNPSFGFEVTTANNVGNNDDVNNKKSINYAYHEYNKDIVKAYEFNYLTDTNQNNIKQLILRQIAYIEKLSVAEKRIIQDYTREQSFNFYNDYMKSKLGFGAWDYSACNFCDSFYPQINALFKNKLSDEDYTHWLNNPRPYNIGSPSPIILLESQWEHVLIKFIEDLNNIIIHAPVVENEIYCYRGSTSHYITGGNITAAGTIRLNEHEVMRSYQSTRLGSFSLDFNVSKRFIDTADNQTKCIYRTTFMTGSRVLYVAPLSMYGEEVEFISPVNTILLYKSNSVDTLPATISYNNITKQYGICSKVPFNSYDIILFATPQPDAGYRAQELAQNITNSLVDRLMQVGNFCNICN